MQQLRIALEALINDRAIATRGKPPVLPHILLVGPPGVGKSMFASIIARETGGNLFEELAQNIFGPPSLHGLLMLPDEGDLVMVDEIHELPSLGQTTLYRALEESRLFLPASATGERQSITLPPFTFVAATTDEWALAKPLRDRFKIVLRLEHYSESELAELIAQRTRRIGWQIENEAVHEIAKRGRGTPRIAIRLLDCARRVSRAEAAETITFLHARKMCAIEGLDNVGLDPLEQRYLRILEEARGPVRLNVLATRLALPRQTIERIIEQDLLRFDLIAKEDSGRMLTSKGIDHLADVPF